MTPLCRAAQAELPIGWQDHPIFGVSATVGGVELDPEQRGELWRLDAWVGEVCVMSPWCPTLRAAAQSILSEPAPEPGPGWQPDDLAKRDRILAVLRGVLERAP